MNRRTVLAGLVGGGAAFAGCLDRLTGRESRTVESTYDLPAGTPLAVRVENGALDVDPHDGTDVEVTAEIDGPSRDAIDAVEVTAGERDGAFEVAPTGTGDSVAVALTVRYPRGTAIDRAETANGSLDVAVTGVTSESTLRTGNGSLVAALDPALDVTVTARTENGSVAVDGFDFEVDESAGTVSGTLGDGSNALTVRTGNGSLELRSYSP